MFESSRVRERRRSRLCRSAAGQKGFTLIELMIVIAIIGILAAIAIPAYQNYVIRAQVSEGLAMSSGAKVAIWDYFTDHGSYPPSNESAGLALPASLASHYVTSIDIAGGKIRVEYGNESNVAIKNATLTLSPSTAGGSIDWRCNSSDLKPAYLPSVCR